MPARLARLEYRERDGTAVPVFALAPGGAALAAESSPALPLRTGRRVGHQFLEHALLLNDVLLDLLLLSSGEEGARSPLELPFRWQGEEKGALEFRAFDRHRGTTARVSVRPDAVLTFPFRRRRLFLEAETGTQSIATARRERTGAILAKLDRYASYFLGASGRRMATWYLRAFPDGYAPRVVFLVRSEARRNRVREAVAAFTGPLAPARFRVAVLTFAEAGRAFAAYLPPADLAGGAPLMVRVDPASARRAEAACAKVAETLAAARRVIRDHNEATRCRLPLPPALAEEVRVLRAFLDPERLGLPRSG